jgi:hypothetical protein
MRPMPPLCRPEHTEGKVLVPVGRAAPFHLNWHSTVKWLCSLGYWLVKSYWYASLVPLKVPTLAPSAASVATVGDP